MKIENEYECRIYCGSAPDRTRKGTGSAREETKCSFPDMHFFLQFHDLHLILAGQEKDWFWSQIVRNQKSTRLFVK